MRGYRLRRYAVRLLAYALLAHTTYHWRGYRLRRYATPSNILFHGDIEEHAGEILFPKVFSGNEEVSIIVPAPIHAIGTRELQ